MAVVTEIWNLTLIAAEKHASQYTQANQQGHESQQIVGNILVPTTKIFRGPRVVTTVFTVLGAPLDRTHPIRPRVVVDSMQNSVYQQSHSSNHDLHRHGDDTHITGHEPAKFCASIHPFLVVVLRLSFVPVRELTFRTSGKRSIWFVRAPLIETVSVYPLGTAFAQTWGNQELCLLLRILILVGFETYATHCVVVVVVVRAIIIVVAVQ